MGQVSDDVKHEIPAIAAEVDALRERTQEVAAELERRLRARAAQARHALARVKRAADVPARLKEHPRVTIVVSSVAVVALGAGVYVLAARVVERRRRIPRLKRRLAAYRALLTEPHRALRKKEPIGKRLLAAMLIAGATTIVKGLSTLLVKRAIEPRYLPPRRVSVAE